MQSTVAARGGTVEVARGRTTGGGGGRREQGDTNE